MQPVSETYLDAASAISRGRREYQEDAVIADFPVGDDVGLIVLSDGMGGHASGDVASKIVMTEVFCELKFQSAEAETFEENMQGILANAMDGANQCLAAHIAENPRSRGMGATLIGAVFKGTSLHWISVGDSPLYLYRHGHLKQLNEDHSMAPQIDLMADNGIIDRETARDHPDRNALLSVLAGDEITRIDCPDKAVELEDGDVVIAASDGLQFMEDAAIAALIAENRAESSAEIARVLLNELELMNDPEQDNISMVVVRVETGAARDEMAAALKSAMDFADGFEEEPSEDELEPAVEAPVLPEVPAEPIETAKETEPAAEAGANEEADEPDPETEPASAPEPHVTRLEPEVPRLRTVIAEAAR